MSPDLEPGETTEPIRSRNAQEAARQASGRDLSLEGALGLSDVAHGLRGPRRASASHVKMGKLRNVGDCQEPPLRSSGIAVWRRAFLNSTSVLGNVVRVSGHASVLTVANRLFDLGHTQSEAPQRLGSASGRNGTGKASYAFTARRWWRWAGG